MPSSQIDDFKNGVVASGSWPFQANTLIADKQPIATLVPKEGRHRLGRYHAWCTAGEEPHLCLQVAGALPQQQAAGDPPGSAPCPWCQPPARAMPCSGKRVQDQRHRQLRSGSLLAYPCLPSAEPGNLRAHTTAGSPDYIAILGGR